MNEIERLRALRTSRPVDVSGVDVAPAVLRTIRQRSRVVPVDPVWKVPTALGALAAAAAVTFAVTTYYDAASKKDDPRWLLVDVQALRKTRLLALPELRARPELADLIVLRKGNRLSITPVEPAHWKIIEKMLA